MSALFEGGSFCYHHRSMKKLVIAEKPSVGREIARNLGCFSKEKGYIDGSEYIVTWALGHLVELAELDEEEKEGDDKTK